VAAREAGAVRVVELEEKNQAVELIGRVQVVEVAVALELVQAFGAAGNPLVAVKAAPLKSAPWGRKPFFEQ
jgi:hypothetical protein